MVAYERWSQGEVRLYYKLDSYYHHVTIFVTLIYAPGEHRTACLDEVQKLKTECAEGVPELTSRTSSSEAPSCIATLSLSGIGFLYCILTSMVLSKLGSISSHFVGLLGQLDKNQTHKTTD